ncbi:MAG: hypothetical protein ACFFC7_05510 [Candidatus Hermodarchaeota archaeon]
MPIFEQIDNLSVKSNFLLNISVVYSLNGDIQTAIKRIKEARLILAQLGQIAEAKMVQENMIDKLKEKLGK